jgi:hypothetical protein
MAFRQDQLDARYQSGKCEPGWKSKNRARQDCFGD